MKKTIKIPDAFYLLIFMWGIQLAQFLIPTWFQGLGILPREIPGLWQIPVAPWLHHGFMHLIANSIPFLILGSLIQLQSRADFSAATIIITLTAGLGTWIFGDFGLHAGASSLVFGYWAWLVTNAFYCRSIKSFMLAAVALLIYGGLFFSLLSVKQDISWSGHAFGFVGGILSVVLKYKMKAQVKKEGQVKAR